MAEPGVDNLIFDLLEWLDGRDRSYQEVMNAWRTSCPRLPIWEEANDRGLVGTAESNGRQIVEITSAGRAFLERRRAAHGKSVDVTGRAK